MVKITIGKTLDDSKDIGVNPFENIYISGLAVRKKTTITNILLLGMENQGILENNKLLIFDTSRVE